MVLLYLCLPSGTSGRSPGKQDSAQGLELQSGARQAGMYAHDSRSRVTSIEWITIHVLSEVRVMPYSFQAAYLPAFM